MSIAKKNFDALIKRHLRQTRGKALLRLGKHLLILLVIIGILPKFPHALLCFGQQAAVCRKAGEKACAMLHRA